jgi:hypothetical protein
MEYVMESTWTLRFSLLLKVLIDGRFVFSLLQHRVLQLQHEQSNGSNKDPQECIASW